MSNNLRLTNNEIFKQESDGTIRVKGSRITLDTLIVLLKRGETVEQIRDGFPSLSKAQISQVIEWYLVNKNSAVGYFEARTLEADALRKQIESDPQNLILRKILRKRREQLSKG
jgi:uncharacterized protein (DUF433 family)